MAKLSFLSPLIVVFVAIAFTFSVQNQSSILGKGRAADPTPTPVCTEMGLKIISNFDVVKAGEIAEFEVVTADEEKVIREFSWSVSTGTIMSGQGTSKISVLTPADALTKPTPTPTPTEDGFIIMGSWRRTVPLKITAEPIWSENCPATALSFKISIGSRSRGRNFPAVVDSISLDKMEIAASCHPIQTPIDDQDDRSAVISVSVSASDPENDVLTYNYTTSVGKIVGTGATVKWDLTGVASGTYEITVQADDGGRVSGKAVTKTVTVFACPRTKTSPAH